MGFTQNAIPLSLFTMPRSLRVRAECLEQVKLSIRRRYEKRADNYLAILTIAAILIWLK